MRCLPTRYRDKFQLEPHMLIAILMTLALAISAPALAWDKLLTVQGVEVEGDVSQPEFVLIDRAGREVAIPRAALLRLEAGEGGLKAFIKDGTVVEGKLQGKFEIEDGLIKRRFGADEIRTVEFDRYIVIQPGKTYYSCPIRIELDVSRLFSDPRGKMDKASLNGVNCGGLRMQLVDLYSVGKFRAKRESKLEAIIRVYVPAGTDQRLDLSLQLMQGAIKIGQEREFLEEADEGEYRTVRLLMNFDGRLLSTADPQQKLLVQLVSESSDQKIEKGSSFWWFTLPSPM